MCTAIQPNTWMLTSTGKQNYHRVCTERIIDQKSRSALGTFWKLARVGERLSPYVSLSLIAMAVGLIKLSKDLGR